MKILGLDISTKTGYAILASESLVRSGLISKEITSNRRSTQGRVIDYVFLDMASEISDGVREHLSPDIDFIYIEQTNQGRNRTSQKQLEFIHSAVLRSLHELGYADKVRYVDSSSWRSFLKIKLSKEDSKKNKLVKQSKERGKVTSKHLVVRWVNEKYNLDLLLKDNDEADAIAVATYGFNYEAKEKPSITEIDIDNVFS